MFKSFLKKIKDVFNLANPNVHNDPYKADKIEKKDSVSNQTVKSDKRGIKQPITVTEIDKQDGVAIFNVVNDIIIDYRNRIRTGEPSEIGKIADTDKIEVKITKKRVTVTNSYHNVKKFKKLINFTNIFPVAINSMTFDVYIYTEPLPNSKPVTIEQLAAVVLKQYDDCHMVVITPSDNKYSKMILRHNDEI